MADHDIEVTGFKAPALDEYGDFRGAQREAVPVGLTSTPFLSVLQRGSPQVNKKELGYIPGAEPGMFFNSVTQEIYEGENTGLEILLCWDDYILVEWVPRGKQGSGGFRGIRMVNDPLVQRLIREQVPEYRGRGIFKKLITEAGTELIETAQLYVLYGPGEQIINTNAQPAIVACSSTKLTPVKRFINKAHNLNYGDIQPPLFAHRWRMTTVYETRDAGDSYNLKFELCAKSNSMEALIPRGKPDAPTPLFAMAEAFQNAVKRGEVRADDASRDGGDAEVSGYRDDRDDRDTPPF